MAATYFKKKLFCSYKCTITYKLFVSLPLFPILPHSTTKVLYLIVSILLTLSSFLTTNSSSLNEISTTTYFISFLLFSLYHNLKVELSIISLFSHIHFIPSKHQNINSYPDHCIYYLHCSNECSYIRCSKLRQSVFT